MEPEEKDDIEKEILKQNLRKAQLENEYYEYVNRKSWLQSKLLIQAVVAGLVFAGTYFFLMNPVLETYKSIADEKSEIANLKSDQARIKALIALENNELQKLLNQKKERELTGRNDSLTIEIEKLISKRSTLGSELSILNDTIKNHKKSLEHLESKNKVLSASYEHLKLENEETKSLFKEIESELAEYKSNDKLNKNKSVLFLYPSVDLALRTIPIILKSTDDEFKNRILDEYFRFAISLHEDFSNLKLTWPLTKSLSKKKTLMQNTVKIFESLSVTDDPDLRIACIYYIAKTYSIFSQNLINSDRPTKLNEGELDQYEILLEDQAFPFEDKAIEFLEIAYNDYKDTFKNGDIGLEYLYKSEALLVELYPSKYGPKSN